MGLLKHGISSVCSQGHADGLRKPCHFVHTVKGCTSGSDFSFCHLPHIPCSSGTCNWPSMQRLRNAKECLNMLHASDGGQLDDPSDLPKNVASQSLCMQKL